MNLPDLLQNEALRRHEFPVCAHQIFLAHAGVCPLPRRVAAAMQQHLDAATRDDQEAVVPDADLRETRRLAARLIGAETAEIAFVSSTSMGLALVASGLPWQSGDNVVCYQDDYPANVYPWLNLGKRGVAMRFVEPQIYGKITVDDLERVVNQQTRLVALSSVHYLSGWRLDVDAIGEYLRHRKILFCLDGIQSFGALHTSVRHVDFAAADSHKWLLGPIGLGLLYVRQEHFDTLSPALVGWHSAACPGFIAQRELVLRPDARRYEPGSLNLTGIIGLLAALRLVHEIGTDVIEQRVLALARLAIDQAKRIGLSVLGPTESCFSGIISVTDPSRDIAMIHRRLVDSKIHVSLRETREGARFLRLSPHFYNSDAELDQMLDSMNCNAA